MVLGSKKGGNKDKGTGKRAASTSASPPAAPPQRVNTGGSSIEDATSGLPSGMAGLLNIPSPPERASTADLQRTGTGGSSSSAAAVPPTGGSLRAIAPAPPGYQQPALSTNAKGKQPAVKQAKPVYKPLRERLPPPVKGEPVWLCCKCLCMRREQPTPQYNRFGWEPGMADLCWLVLKKLKTSVRPETYVEADKDICGHKKCESCIREYYEPDDRKRDPFNFVNEYGTKLNWEQPPWFHGPWKNKYGLDYAIEQFRNYRKSDNPPRQGPLHAMVVLSLQRP